MDYDVLIIGAGPAGYVCCIRAGQVGLRTAVIEKCMLVECALTGVAYLQKQYWKALKPSIR